MEKRYDKKLSKYRQLSAEERGKIEAYLFLHISISEISRLINRSKSTVFEEIKRSRYNGKYKADIAQKCGSHKHTKWRKPGLLRFIELHLLRIGTRH